MATREEHSSRPNRESLSKRLGKVARQIKARDSHRCVYCGATEKTSGAHMHLDHLTPRSKGGEDVATNLVVACRRCNDARKELSLAAWRVYAERVYGLSFEPAKVRAQARKRLPEAA